MERFRNRSILVAGGAGFVGSNLIREIMKERPRKITVVDNLMSSERINVPRLPHVVFIKGSIADDKILSRIDDDLDYIFHLATYHGNQSSIHDPLADHEHSAMTTLKLMNHVKRFKKLKKLVYSSAGCCVAEKTFGKAKATTEDMPISLNQDSPYSISKMIGEFYAVYFCRQYGLPTVRARFQNVYGPGEILGAGKWRGTPATVWRNVIPVFIYKALKGSSLPVENKGRATRDFIYVADVCRGLTACALQGRSGDVYNLATGKESSILDLAYLINELTGNKGGIEYLPKRPWDNSGTRFGSTEKSGQALGFRARTGLREGLEETIEWTKRNLAFIERCIGKHKRHLRRVRRVW